ASVRHGSRECRRPTLARGPLMIALEHASKRFADRDALTDLTLLVAPGEVVALVGPNGAGKSTALRIVAGVIAPTSGVATIAGRDVVRDGREARRPLGYLPQKLGVPGQTLVG